MSQAYATPAWANNETALEARQAARRIHSAMLAKCQRAQAAFPDVYLFDECIAIENASDGSVSDGGPRITGDEWQWMADAYERVARHLEADTAQRMAEKGLDFTAYGLRY